MQPIVELDRVSFGYGSQPILDDISLHIHPGQFSAVVGPSGAGKSTLLKLLVGMLRAGQGRVQLNNEAITGERPVQVGYVPQVDTVDWNFPVTVRQVVLMGKVRGGGIWPWADAAQKRTLHSILERLEIAEYADRHIRDLSGGQQQRVFLARALMAEPDLLVLDEPTAGLDMRTTESTLHLLAHLNRQGITIVMSSHDLNVVAAHLPWVICLNQRIVAEGSPESVFNEEILNETYRSDMMVLRQDGLLLVHQRPHSHTYHDILPNPVLGSHDSARTGDGSSERNS